MKHPSARDIKRSLENPGTFPLNQRKRMDRHIDGCDRCEQLRKHFRKVLENEHRTATGTPVPQASLQSTCPPVQPRQRRLS